MREALLEQLKIFGVVAMRVVMFHEEKIVILNVGVLLGQYPQLFDQQMLRHFIFINLIEAVRFFPALQTVNLKYMLSFDYKNTPISFQSSCNTQILVLCKIILSFGYNRLCHRQQLMLSKMRLAYTVKMVQQIPKYQQMLIYQYPAWMLPSISHQKCKLVSKTYILKNIRMLKNRLRQGRINHDNIQKTVKAGTILMFEAYNRDPQTAFQYMKHYIHTNLPIDYKYSEFYNEGVITKMVGIFRDYTIFGIEWATQFIQYLIKENMILHNRIDRIAEIAGIKRKEPRTRHEYFRLGKQKFDIDNNLPFRTFAFMNRTIGSNQLNQPPKLVRKAIFDQEYQQILDADAAQNAQELACILQREKSNIDACRITKIDYLVAIDFLLTNSKDNQNIVDLIAGYIFDDIAKPQKQVNSSQRIMEVILLARISNSLAKLFPEYSKYVTYYITYAQEYVAILQNMKEVELIELFGRQDKLFQKYLLAEFPPYVNAEPIKEQYLRILTIILNHRKYGDLLYPQQSINGLFQSLLIMCEQSDHETITEILVNYEYYQLFHSSPNSAPAIDACLLAIRYDFHSKVLSDQLASTLQYPDWLSNQAVVTYRSNNFKNDLRMAFEHFICLELREQSQEDGYSQIERRMVDIFESFDPNQICREKKQRVDQWIHMIRKLAFEQIAYLEKWLRIANKISEIARKRKDAQLSQRLSRKVNELMRDRISRQYILDFIAYPDLYALLNNILKHEKSQECQSYLKQIQINLNRYLELNSDEQTKREYPYSNPILYKPFIGCISMHTPKDLSYRPYYGMPYFDIASAREKNKKIQEEEDRIKETISSALNSEPAATEEKIEQIKIIQNAVPKAEDRERKRVEKLKSGTKSQLEGKMKQSLQLSIIESQEPTHKNSKKLEGERNKPEEPAVYVSFFKKPTEDQKLEKKEDNQKNQKNQKITKMTIHKSDKIASAKLLIASRLYSKNRLKKSKNLQSSTTTEQPISQTEKKNFFQKKPEKPEVTEISAPTASPQVKPKRSLEPRKFSLRLPPKSKSMDKPQRVFFFKKDS